MNDVYHFNADMSLQFDASSLHGLKLAVDTPGLTFSNQNRTFAIQEGSQDELSQFFCLIDNGSQLEMTQRFSRQFNIVESITCPPPKPVTVSEVPPVPQLECLRSPFKPLGYGPFSHMFW